MLLTCSNGAGQASLTAGKGGGFVPVRTRVRRAPVGRCTDAGRGKAGRPSTRPAPDRLAPQVARRAVTSSSLRAAESRYRPVCLWPGNGSCGDVRARFKVPDRKAADVVSDGITVPPRTLASATWQELRVTVFGLRDLAFARCWRSRELGWRKGHTAGCGGTTQPAGPQDWLVSPSICTGRACRARLSMVSRSSTLTAPWAANERSITRNGVP